MRLALLSSVLVFTVSVNTPTPAQTPNLELQAGLGYARVFDGGGISFAAAVEHSLSSPASALQHSFGGSLWYAHTTIATAPDDPYGRHIVGLGLRYQIGLGTCCRGIRPFLAVPVQVLQSRIPDRSNLVAAALRVTGIPDSPPPRPVEDRIGSEWGWSTGLELGVKLGLSERVSALTSVQGLYQNIYGRGTRNGAWNWHGGITYQIGRS